MPNVFSVPLGPSLGHQLLHALLHHIHPILWRFGIPVSPHFCQVGDKGSPCCSHLPPVPDEPSLSSAVPHRPSLLRSSGITDLTVCYPGCSHCFTLIIPQFYLLAAELVEVLGIFPCPRDGSARILLSFLIPRSHALPNPNTFMHYFFFPLWSRLDPSRVPQATLFPAYWEGNS